MQGLVDVCACSIHLGLPRRRYRLNAKGLGRTVLERPSSHSQRLLLLSGDRYDVGGAKLGPYAWGVCVFAASTRGSHAGAVAVDGAVKVLGSLHSLRCTSGGPRSAASHIMAALVARRM